MDKYTKPSSSWSCDHDDAGRPREMLFYLYSSWWKTRWKRESDRRKNTFLWVSLLPSHHHLSQKIKKQTLIGFSSFHSKGPEKMDRSSVVVKVHTRDIVDILYGSFGGKLECYMLNSTFILLIKFIVICGRVDQKSQFSG